MNLKIHMKSNFQIKVSPAKQIAEDDREDESSASESGDSGCLSESDGSSTFSDASAQC